MKKANAKENFGANRGQEFIILSDYSSAVLRSAVAVTVGSQSLLGFIDLGTNLLVRTLNLLYTMWVKSMKTSKYS